MKKIPFIMLGFVVLLVGITFVFKACDQSDTQAVIKSAYQVIADQKIYYTDSYVSGVDKYGEYYTLNGYWDYKGEAQGWRYSQDKLYLSRRAYKTLEVNIQK